MAAAPDQIQDQGPALTGLLGEDALDRLAGAWGPRFGDPVPWVARALVRGVLVAVAADAAPSVGVEEAAAGLGVLRARQGHDAATVVEDLLALRPHVEQLTGPSHRLSVCLERGLRAAVGALTNELSLPAADGPPTRDLLTGVLSRAVLEEAVTHEVLSASRYGAPSLVVVDLDGLTRFMEVHGHLAGDLQLMRAVEIITAASRRSDPLGRLGVDQLAVLLPRTDVTRALVVARRVLARSLADARAGQRADPATAADAPRLSVGVGFLSAPRTAAELLQAADQALQRARQAGGRVVETNRPDEAPVAQVAPVAPEQPLAAR